MKFFFSGELDHRIDDAYSPVMKAVEARLNTRCGDRDYGSDIIEIAIIPMILGPEFLKGRPERKLLQRKQCTADYRTIIDYEKFRMGDEAQRQRLLIKNTVEAIYDLKRKVGKHFQADALVSDVLAEFGLGLTEVQNA